MAIYHLSVKPVSRSSGRSAVAAAAYRTGERIVDHAHAIVHDYTRRGGVAHTELIVPDDAPAWAREPSELWSAAERAERRCDARTAREIELALPNELTLEQNVELVRSFARGLTQRDRAATHVAVHVPHHGSGDHRNVHAHLLRTTRRLGPSGLGEKTAEWDGSGGPALVRQTRELWAQHVNAALHQLGSATRIDHRSYRDQGRQQLPTVHLGHQATMKERLGIPSRIGDENRTIAAINGVLRDLGTVAHRDDGSEPEILRRAAHIVREHRKSVEVPSHAVSGELAGVATLQSGPNVALVDVGPHLVAVPTDDPRLNAYRGESVRIEVVGARWHVAVERVERVAELLRELAGDVQRILKQLAHPPRVRIRDDAERLYGSFAAARDRDRRERETRIAALRRGQTGQARALARSAVSATSREQLRDLAREARALQRFQRQGRVALREQLGPKLTWSRYVTQRAQGGDDVAIAVLYRMQAAHRGHERAAQRFELERERTPVARTIDGYTFEVEGGGTVAYKDDRGTVAFRDTGRTIDVFSDDARGALKIARVNHDGAIGVRGSATFRDRALRDAVEIGVDVRDRELLGRVREIVNELAAAVRSRAARHTID
jgi:hypothetical protein